MSNLTDAGHGRFVIDTDGRRQSAWAVADGARTWVFIGGHTWVIEPAASERRTGAGADAGALASPMPAKVVQVAVTSGDHVQTGDLLVLLEAMKMELAIKAPRDAVVRAVRCQPGDLVQAGVPLVELS